MVSGGVALSSLVLHLPIVQESRVLIFPESDVVATSAKQRPRCVATEKPETESRNAKFAKLGLVALPPPNHGSPF